MATALVPSLAFNQPDGAFDLLASLEKIENINYALVYDEHKNQFAYYGDLINAVFLDEIEKLDSIAQIENNLHVVEQIYYNNKLYGYVQLAVSTKVLEDLLIEHGIVSLLIGLLVLIIAYFFTKSFRGTITGPILDLAEATNKISKTKDYSVRMHVSSDDEFSELYDGFNDMLAQIQLRDQEKEEARKVLVESERKFRALFEDSPVPLWEENFSVLKEELEKLKEKGVSNLQEYFKENKSLLDQLGNTVKIVNLNKAALKLYNATSKEELKHGLSKIFTINTIDPFIEQLQAIFDGKSSCEVETEMQTLDGNPIFIRLNWVVVPGYEDSFEKVFVSTIDITKRKIAEKELICALKDAEKADRLKSTFLAQMSHEIRTPINAILSLSSLIQSDLESLADDDTKISFGLINKAGKRLVRTIELLLNLSEIQAGSYNPIMKQFNLYSDVLSKVVLEYKTISADKGIELNLKIDTENSNLVGDSYTVSQIFEQLIDNAIKYTNIGSVDIRVFRISNHLIVDVKDTGIGISDEYIPNLFQAFTQEEMGYTRKYEGSGIGLALVKYYCEINKAEIEVESKKNKGTTFRIIFNSN